MDNDKPRCASESPRKFQRVRSIARSAPPFPCAELTLLISTCHFSILNWCSVVVKQGAWRFPMFELSLKAFKLKSASGHGKKERARKLWQFMISMMSAKNRHFSGLNASWRQFFIVAPEHFLGLLVQSRGLWSSLMFSCSSDSFSGCIHMHSMYNVALRTTPNLRTVARSP